MIWCFLDIYFSVAAPALYAGASPYGLLKLFWYLYLTIAERQADSQTQTEPLICWGTISKQQFVAFHLLSQDFFVNVRGLNKENV